tara:strand:+ start:5580 stop:6194 length:615 start_codon:yes stop_codon:yes gene_type:complete
MKHTLLENLYIKRFCLPCNTDIRTFIPNLKNKKSGSSSLMLTSNDYNHVAIVFDQGKIVANNNELFMTKTEKIISYGYNTYGDMDSAFPGTHAEIDAINKLTNFRTKHNRNQTKQINMFITRISTNAKIQNSKPCSNCIKKMIYLSSLKGYKIKHIFYSDNNGLVIQTNLKALEQEPQHNSLFYRNNNSLKKSIFNMDTKTGRN